MSLPDDRELGDTRAGTRLLADRVPGPGRSRRGGGLAPERALDSDDVVKTAIRDHLLGRLGWVALMILLAVFADLLPLANPNFQNYSAVNTGPSIHHLLGTDDLGRDLLSRIIFGSRVSLVIGFVFGRHRPGGRRDPRAPGGLQGRPPDIALNAGSFVILAFPALLAIMVIEAFWGVVGCGSSPSSSPSATIPLLFRVIRATTLSFASREFVVAARAMGARTSRILFRELLPNVVPAARLLRPDRRGRRHRPRGIARLPGSVDRAADAVVGQHHQRRGQQQQPADQPATSRCGRRSPSSCSSCPSTSWPTACASASTSARGSCDARLRSQRQASDARVPRRRELRPSRSSRSRTCTRRSAPTGARARRRRRLASPSTGARRSAWWASRARARPCSPLDHGAAPGRATWSKRGTVRFAGHELTAMSPDELREVWGAEMGMVFQDPMTALNPVVRIGTQITESLRLRLGSTAPPPTTPRSRCSARWDPLPRAAPALLPARALGRHAPAGHDRHRPRPAARELLLADEPTTGLDVTVQAQILDLLAAHQRERHMAMILVTHDLGVVANRTDEIVVMYAGRIVEQAPTRTSSPTPACPTPRRCCARSPAWPSPRTRACAPSRAAPRPRPPAARVPLRPALSLRPGPLPEEEPPLRTAGPEHLFAVLVPGGQRRAHGQVRHRQPRPRRCPPRGRRRPTLRRPTAPRRRRSARHRDRTATEQSDPS